MEVSKMKLEKTLYIVLTAAVGVGFFAGLAGYLYGVSYMAYADADMFDAMADGFVPLLGAENVQSIRNSARDLRNTSIQLRDYAMYCVIGAILVGAVETGGVFWNYYKEKERLASKAKSSGF